MKVIKRAHKKKVFGGLQRPLGNGSIRKKTDRKNILYKRIEGEQR